MTLDYAKMAADLKKQNEIDADRESHKKLTACEKCVRPNCKDREWNMFTCALQMPVDDTPIDDLNACYQREFIPGNSHKWKTDITWTDSLANTPDLRRERSGNPAPEPTTLEAAPEVFEEVPPALHEAYRQVLEQAEEIWLDRQGQYGLTPFPEKPSVLLSLIQVKLWRLEGDYGAEDGWLDLLNYAAMGLMVARGEWE